MTASSPTLDLACELIARRSVTPDDAGCQEILANRLRQIGFKVESLPAGDVENLWATLGDSGPLLVFAGHTDVVPPGPDQEWRTGAFDPAVVDGCLYGRGSADMKSALAAMVTAMEDIERDNVKLAGRVGFLVTSDEEGVAINGSRHVMQVLASRNEKIDWCIVGEPSSKIRLGDTIRIGRRGSLNGELTIFGTQGHVAYPDKACNPIHALAPVIHELCTRQWDDGTDEFPPTTFQVSNFNAGTGADNVIPGSAAIAFNFRYSPASRMATLQAAVSKLLNDHDLQHELRWRDSGQPFISRPGPLRDAVMDSVSRTQGIQPECDTGGGTSDGRFIAPTGAEVIELGLVNATIHKINEHASVRDIESLAGIYKQIVKQLLAN